MNRLSPTKQLAVLHEPMTPLSAAADFGTINAVPTRLLREKLPPPSPPPTAVGGRFPLSADH